MVAGGRVERDQAVGPGGIAGVGAGDELRLCRTRARTCTSPGPTDPCARSRGRRRRGFNHVSVVAPANTVHSAPATNFDPDNHSQNVYFAGADGSLQEKPWVSGSGWKAITVIVPAGSVAAAPATNYDPANHSQNTYFEGPDGSLREISWTPSGSFSHVSTVAPAHSLGSAPATNYDADNETQNVFFEGPDGSLREISWASGHGWGHVIVVVPAGSLASAPATNYDPDNHSQNVYFAGPGRLAARDLMDPVGRLQPRVGGGARRHPCRCADHRAAAHAPADRQRLGVGRPAASQGASQAGREDPAALEVEPPVTRGWSGSASDGCPRTPRSPSPAADTGARPTSSMSRGPRCEATAAACTPARSTARATGCSSR